MSRYPSPPRNVYHISSRSRATTPERHIARQALRAVTQDYQPNLYPPSAQDFWPRGRPTPPSMPPPNPKVEVRRRAVSQPRKRAPPPLHIPRVPELLPNVQVIQMPDAPTPYPPPAAALSESPSVQPYYSDSECDARGRGRQRGRQATAPAADARRSITTPRVEAFLSSKSESDLQGLFKKLTKGFTKEGGERPRRTEVPLLQQLQSSAVKRNMARQPGFVPMPAKTEGTHDDIVFATMVPDDAGGKACFQHLPGVNLVQAADVRGGLMLANAKTTPMIGKEKDRNGYIKICLQWPCYDEPHVDYIELGHGSSIMTLSLVYQVAAITCEWFQATRKAHPRSNGTHKEWKVASKETSDGVHENHLVLHGLRHIGREYWVPILYWNFPGSRP